MRRRKMPTSMRDGEELLWTGTPCEDKFYGSADRVLLPVTLVILGASTFCAALVGASMIKTGISLEMMIEFVLLLVVLALAVYGYFLRFVVKHHVKSDLVYGITNQRRLLIRDNAANHVFQYDCRDLKDAYISEMDRNGVGTIYLEKKRPGNFLDNTGLDFLGSGDGAHTALFDVQNCEKVLKLIQGKRV